jgi:hypothetical protein
MMSISQLRPIGPGVGFLGTSANLSVSRSPTTRVVQLSQGTTTLAHIPSPFSTLAAAHTCAGNAPTRPSQLRRPSHTPLNTKHHALNSSQELPGIRHGQRRDSHPRRGGHGNRRRLQAHRVSGQGQTSSRRRPFQCRLRAHDWTRPLRS